MIQQRWSRSRDDPDPEMMPQRWSRSRDDPDPVMMIQIEGWSRSSDDGLDRGMIQIQWWWSRSRWRLLEDEGDLKIEMTWRWRWWGLNDDIDDIEKNTCTDKLCRENSFLVKRECWCNCNFGMYSSIYLMCCTPIFILGCVYNVIESCHTPMFILGSFYNINKWCQVIVGNPPIGQGLKSPQLWGPRVIRLC